jgi:osomolarity two-component system, response regulator SKN7
MIGMNDVLPKPFTKEGLLNMLEKHLQHLKKPLHGMDAMGVPQPVQPLAHTSAKQSMKDEDSPGSFWGPSSLHTL